MFQSSPFMQNLVENDDNLWKLYQIHCDVSMIIYQMRYYDSQTLINLSKRYPIFLNKNREMERNRKSASLITQNVLIISIENSFVLALIRSLEKLQRKTARHVKKAGFYVTVT